MSSPSTSASAPGESGATTRFKLQSTTLSLSGIPPNSILTHATNCFGIWGAGVALAIQELFPNADKVYAAHCDSFRPTKDEWPSREGLAGGICIVPPQRGDHSAETKTNGDVEGIWIACLFTSYSFGRPTKKKAGLDKKSVIWQQTESALRELRALVDKLESGEFRIEEKKEMRSLKADFGKSMAGKKRKRQLGDIDGENPENKKQKNEIEVAVSEPTTKGTRMDIYSPQFNSGSFGIPWERTRKLIEEVFADWNGNWFVLPPPRKT